MDTKETCAHIWKQIYNPNSMVPDIEVGVVFDILIETVEKYCYSHVENPVSRKILARLAVKGEQSYKSFISSVEFNVDMEDGEDFDDFDAKCEAEKKARAAALQSLTEKGLIKCVEDVYSLA